MKYDFKVLIFGLVLTFADSLRLNGLFERQLPKQTRPSEALINLEDALASIKDDGMLERCIRDKLPITKGSRNDVVGCWQVVDTVGEPAWQKYAKVLSVGSRNRNFQIFSGDENTQDNRFVNVSEYIGEAVHAVAIGTYKESSERGKDGSLMLEATVSRIELNAWGVRVGFNVDGKGLVNLMFAEGDLRVLRNEDSAFAVQRRQPASPQIYLQYF
jgi:hypothetical protein